MGEVPRVAVPSDQPSTVFDVLKRALIDKDIALFPFDPARGEPHLDAVPIDAAVVVETSGSTGTPKRVWLSAEAMLWSASMTVEAAGPRGTWWLALPCHYIAGLQVLTRSVVSETAPIIATALGSTAERLLASVPELRAARESQQPLYTSLVPAQLANLLDQAESDEAVAEVFSLFSRVLVGGQRVPGGLVERAERFGVTVTRTYGAAETAGGCVWDGVPLPGVAVDVIEGRIAVAGPMLAGGYLDNESLEAEAFVQRGEARWFVSSDTGSFDGALSVSGRADDVFISGGVKVTLGEIEAVVHGLGVTDALVVARDDQRWGQVPVIVTTRTVDLDRIRDAVGRALGDAARPAAVVTVEKIPTLSSGKPDRLAVAKRVSTETAYHGQP